MINLIHLFRFVVAELLFGDARSRELEECGAEIDSRTTPQPSASRRRRTESADYPTRPVRTTDPVAAPSTPIGSASF